jgi:ribosomal protein S18 acetylase RimI-like enzyme
MNTNISFLHLTKLDSAYLDQVEPMFYDYYKSMEDKGLIIKIVEDGGKLWRKSIENSLGKNQNVVVALKDGKVLSFTWGFITLYPSYLGSKIIGSWNGIYVLPEYRSLGLSKMMYLELEKWFIERNVHSVECSVLLANTTSINGFKNMGYQEERIYARKLFAKDTKE